MECPPAGYAASTYTYSHWVLPGGIQHTAIHSNRLQEACMDANGTCIPKEMKQNTIN
jgi:hypothetical protein